jgi:peptidyl-prolyl cis-trans isomerase D
MDFATIARKYSAGPEAASGGELPIYSADQMPDVFRAAFDLKEGEVSGVLSSPYGYHLIKLVKMYPGREVTFDDAADEARLKVLEAKKREAVAAWTARARAAASSWMDEKLLDSIP